MKPFFYRQHKRIFIWVIVGVCLLFLSNTLDGQSLTYNIDSLEARLKNVSESERAELLLQIGFEYSYIDSLESGLKYLKSALEIAEKLKRKDLMAKAYYHLGDLYFQFDDFPNAQASFSISYNLSEEIRNLRLMAYSSVGLGNVYMINHDWKNASKYLNRALSMAEKECLKEDIPKIINQLGNMFSDQNLNDSALFYYHHLLKSGEEFNDSMMMGYAYINIAIIFIRQEQYQEAINLLNKALKIYTVRTKPKIASTIFLNIGRAYQMIGKKTLALKYLQDALNIAGKQGYLTIQISGSKYVSDLYAESGAHEKALKYYTDYAAFKDSLFTVKKERELLNINFRHELQQAEKQLAVMEQKALVRNLILYFSLFTLLFLIILSMQYYRAFKNKLRIKEMEKERMVGTIDQQSRDLVSLAMNLSHKQQLIAEIQDRTKNVTIPEDNREIQGYISNISGKISSDGFFDREWKVFMKHFNGVHPSFFHHLQERHPELTSHEIKYCAFVKLNLQSKEIAQINHISLRSVYMIRYRLRRKLGISEKDDLDKYICQIN